MDRWYFSFVLFLCLGGINSSAQAQAQYQSPSIPEATLEGTRRATESLRNRVEPLPDAKRVVGTEIVGMAIALDVIQQHMNCFLGAEAAKAGKAQLLDYELTEAQRKKVDVIFSPQYRAEFVKTPAFEALKMEIASSISRMNGRTLSKAVELSQDEVGLDFVLAWLQPFLREKIDKSCGTNPAEATLDDWKSKMSWAVMVKKFSLD